MDREQINKLLNAAVEKKLKAQGRIKPIPSPVKKIQSVDVGIWERLTKGTAESQNATNRSFWLEQCSDIAAFNKVLEQAIEKLDSEISRYNSMLDSLSENADEGTKRDLKKRLNDAISHEIGKVNRQKLLISGEFTRMSLTQIMSSEDSDIKEIVDLLDWKAVAKIEDLKAKYSRLKSRIEELHRLSTEYLEGTDFNLDDIINDATETAELRITKAAYDIVTHQRRYKEELTRLIYHDAFLPSLLDELGEIKVSEEAFEERTYDEKTSSLHEHFTNKLFSTLSIYFLKLSLPKDASNKEQKELSLRLNSYISSLSTKVKQKSKPVALEEQTKSILVSHNTGQDDSACDESSVGSIKSDKTNGTVKSAKRKRIKVLDPDILLSQEKCDFHAQCRSIGSRIRTDNLGYDFLEFKFPRMDESFSSIGSVDFSYASSPDERDRRKSTGSSVSNDSPIQSFWQIETAQNTKINSGSRLSEHSSLYKENKDPGNNNGKPVASEDCISPAANIK